MGKNLAQPRQFNARPRLELTDQLVRGEQRQGGVDLDVNIDRVTFRHDIDMNVVYAQTQPVGNGPQPDGDRVPFRQRRLRAGFNVHHGIHQAGNLCFQLALDLARNRVRLLGRHGRIDFDIEIEMHIVIAAAAADLARIPHAGHTARHIFDKMRIGHHTVGKHIGGFAQDAARRPHDVDNNAHRDHHIQPRQAELRAEQPDQRRERNENIDARAGRVGHQHIAAQFAPAPAFV